MFSHKVSSGLGELFKSYHADKRYPIFKVCRWLDLDSRFLKGKTKRIKSSHLRYYRYILPKVKSMKYEVL